jgi:DNA polymerase
VRLFPIYHPAAALYTPSTLEALRADFHRIPEILALGPLPQPQPVPDLEIPEPAEPEDDGYEFDPSDAGSPEATVSEMTMAEAEHPEPPVDAVPPVGPEDSPAEQLGLF